MSILKKTQKSNIYWSTSNHVGGHWGHPKKVNKSKLENLDLKKFLDTVVFQIKHVQFKQDFTIPKMK